MKIFIITGAGQENNLGFKICKAISENIKNSFVIAINEDGKDVPVNHPAHMIYDCDLSSYHSIYNLLFEIKKFLSDQIDPELHLINVAGYNKLSWFDDLDFSEHERMMMVNCTAPVYIINKLLPELTKLKGTVLNIISMGAIRPFRASHSYNVSKAAYRMATLQLGRELTKKNGITVFGISPNDLEGTGMTIQLTDEIAKIRGWTLEEAEQYRIAGAVNPRLTKPDSLAEFISFILADKERHHQFSGVEIQYGI